MVRLGAYADALAHPRSRGENPYNLAHQPLETGSSPLTRGKPPIYGGGALPPRLIPAHAGKTFCARTPREQPPAHPRSRGENGDDELHVQVPGGSSPLTRGKRGITRLYRHEPRLIPAHAGKTCACRESRSAGRAHPRSRGENCARTRRGRWPWGSSPLTRGKLPGPRNRPAGRRLIPAHAGKTSPRAPPDSRHEAHPRSRGENLST